MYIPPLTQSIADFILMMMTELVATHDKKRGHNQFSIKYLFLDFAKGIKITQILKACDP